MIFFLTLFIYRPNVSQDILLLEKSFASCKQNVRLALMLDIWLLISLVKS